MELLRYLGSRLGPWRRLLRVRLRLAHECAVLQLANRLVGSRNDFLAFLETIRDLKVLLSGDPYFYGPEGHFVVRSYHEHALDVLLVEILGWTPLTEANRGITILQRLVLAHRQRDDRH